MSPLSRTTEFKRVPVERAKAAQEELRSFTFISETLDQVK
jgi:hypothetical protein